jgi:tetratricopeptide (TPR) repeat protein
MVEATDQPVRTRPDPVAQLADELDDVLLGRRRDLDQAAAVLERAVLACRSDPRIAEAFERFELLSELSEVYEQQGRVEEALTAMRQAIAAGYRSQPDPRCRLAEIQLRAGRTEPAGDLFAQVHTEFPDDVWLYNNAGLEYGAAGDPETALSWLSPGLALALDTGDPEGLVAQLADLRREQLEALDQARDELDARAEAFLAEPRPEPAAWSPSALAEVFAALEATPSTPLAPTAVVPPGPPTATSGVAHAVAWFPAGEFPTALQLWPKLGDDWDTREHTDYCQRLERHLRDLADRAAGPTRIAPIHLEAFQRWAARQDRDASSADTRARYAADQARTNPAELITWPPERNQPCWCHSGRKYKKCCGHPAAVTATY